VAPASQPGDAGGAQGGIDQARCEPGNAGPHGQPAQRASRVEPHLAVDLRTQGSLQDGQVEWLDGIRCGFRRCVRSHTCLSECPGLNRRWPYLWASGRGETPGGRGLGLLGLGRVGRPLRFPRRTRTRLSRTSSCARFRISGTLPRTLPRPDGGCRSDGISCGTTRTRRCDADPRDGPRGIAGGLFPRRRFPLFSRVRIIVSVCPRTGRRIRTLGRGFDPMRDHGPGTTSSAVRVCASPVPRSCFDLPRREQRQTGDHSVPARRRPDALVRQPGTGSSTRVAAPPPDRRGYHRVERSWVMIAFGRRPWFVPP
jgi:hypothetical protein